MASAIDIEVYSDVMVVLGTAGLLVPVVRRFGISPVLGYLLAGAVLGPQGLGALSAVVPLVHWITVVDAETVASIGDLGVVFLLFLIGLELSYERLKTLRRLVFGLGGAQVILSAGLIAAVAGLAGMGAGPATVLGACLALSSTAIVIEVLSLQGRMATATGRVSFAVLLAQDLAVIPILIFVSILAGGAQGSVSASLALALVNAALAIGGIVLVGRLMFRPLFRLVAQAGSTELFVATTLFVIIGAGVVAGLAGLSMALGAFVAGLLLAETEFRKAIEATIEPFKGLLLGLFFFSVGMKIDLPELVRDPLILALAAVGLVAGKAVVTAGLARAFRQPWPAAVESALLLGPGGEFAFVGLGLATSLGLMPGPIASFALTLTAITMALIPALSRLGRHLAARAAGPQAPDPELAVRPTAASGHAIILGFGRVGQLVSTMLDRHNLAHVAVDSDPRNVPKLRRQGRAVYYGNATDADFLRACGLDTARAVIVTVASAPEIEEIVARIRSLRPDVIIVSRARDALHAQRLYEIGVTDAVPETLEASLQLSEAALLGLGQAAGRVIASIHDQRDVFRKSLQEAAAKNGAAAPRLRRGG